MTEITLGDVTPEVLALRVDPSQTQFVGPSVQSALDEAAAHPEAAPWFRGVFADDEAVGFVMLSWKCVPDPPRIIGPWFLWKLLIDARHQGRGYGAEVVRQVAALVAAEGATELLTSYVEADGGPAGFYERLGFRPTGDLADGEVIAKLRLAATA